MKKSPSSPVIRETQVQTAQRFHLTPVRSQLEKKNKQCECGLKGALTCWWEYKLVQSLWKLVWRVLKKLEVDLPSGPAIHLVSIYPKTPRQHDYRDGYPSMFIAAQFTVVQLWNQPRCSSREKWPKKIYIHNGIF